MKKITIVFLSVFLCLTLLVGCGGASAIRGPSADTDKQADQETDKSSNKEVTLKLYYWDEQFKPVIDKTIQAFQKENANIKMESTVIPWAQYWTKLQTSLPTSSGPDIFWLNFMYANEFIPKQLLLEVNKDIIDTNNYPESTITPFTKEGKLYGVPFNLDTIALLYNKELFDKAGVAYPNDKWTWDDLLNAAKKLTIKDSSGKIQQYGFVAEPASQACTFPFILQNGGKIYNEDNSKCIVNSPESQEAIQFLYDMMYKEGVSPTAAQQQEVSKDQLFSSGKLAMMNHVTPFLLTMYEALGEKVDVAQLPMKQQRATTVNALSFAVSAKTKNPEECIKFLKFAATKEAAEIMAEKTAPALKGAGEKWTQSFGKINAKAFLDDVEYGVPLPLSEKNAGATRKAFETEMSNILMKQKDVATGLSDAEKTMNAEISK